MGANDVVGRWRWCGCGWNLVSMDTGCMGMSYLVVEVGVVEVHGVRCHCRWKQLDPGVNSPAFPFASDVAGGDGVERWGRHQWRDWR